MKGFIFTDKDIDTNGIFYARITPNIFSVEQLFDALYYSCWFPTYFGSNWDALDEVVRDFSWIKEKKIIVRHESLPKISNKDLSVYLAILDGSFEYFDENDKDICYVFSKRDEQEVRDILLSIERSGLFEG